MTTRTYATFDPSRLAPGLSLDPSLLIVTTNPNATADNNNTVFGSLPFSVGDHFVEGYYWSTLHGDLTGLCWVQNFHKMYTAYGGQVHVFNTVDGSEIDNSLVTVQGTALDVAYMDATTNAAN